MVSATGHPAAAPARLRAVDGSGRIIDLAAAQTSRDLAVLLHESAAADEWAFAELYDATATRVYGLAVRILRSPSLAEEAALEAYLEVWRTSARFRSDQCSPLAWMLAIVLRRVVDRLDVAGDAVRHPALVSVPALGHDAEATSEEAAQLLEALAGLGPGQLEALESACRDERGRDHAETVRLCTILSTLVGARLRDDVGADGSPYLGPSEMAPPRGVSGGS